jgi:hypothetical protein
MNMKATDMCKFTKSRLKFTDYSRCVLFNFEDESRTFLRNVGKLLSDCMTSHARRYQPSSGLKIS